MDTKTIKQFYSDYSILFHICMAIFLLNVRYQKQKTGVNIDIFYLKMLGILTIIMGIIFFSFGNDLINVD